MVIIIIIIIIIFNFRVVMIFSLHSLILYPAIAAEEYIYIYFFILLFSFV